MSKRHSLIIGGSKGIGKSLVQLLASENRIVSVISREIPKNKIPGTVTYYSADLLNKSELLKTLDQIVKKHGKIDELAFFQRYRGKGDDWSGEIETTLSSTKSVIDHLSPHFSREASIVLVSSVNSLLISDHLPLGYHVAKAGLVQIGRYYASKLGPKGIRVNSISPGTVLKEESKDFIAQDQSLKTFYEHAAPLGRMGTPNEVAEVAAFLLGPKSSFVTGQNIAVDGGISIQWQETISAKLNGSKARGSKN